MALAVHGPARWNPVQRWTLHMDKTLSILNYRQTRIGGGSVYPMTWWFDDLDNQALPLALVPLYQIGSQWTYDVVEYRSKNFLAFGLGSVHSNQTSLGPWNNVTHGLDVLDRPSRLLRHALPTHPISKYPWSWSLCGVFLSGFCIQDGSQGRAHLSVSEGAANPEELRKRIDNFALSNRSYK